MAQNGAPTHALERQGRWKQGGGMVGRYTRGESAGSALRYLQRGPWHMQKVMGYLSCHHACNSAPRWEDFATRDWFATAANRQGIVACVVHCSMAFTARVWSG